MLLLQALDDRGFDDFGAGATIHTDGDGSGGSPGRGDDGWKGEAPKDDGTAGGTHTQQTAPGDPVTREACISTQTIGYLLFHKRFPSIALLTPVASRIGHQSASKIRRFSGFQHSDITSPTATGPQSCPISWFCA